MSFNGRLRQQEKLSKEDVQLLRKAMEIAMRNEDGWNTRDSVVFLIKKLERMEKAFR